MGIYQTENNIMKVEDVGIFIVGFFGLLFAFKKTKDVVAEKIDESQEHKRKVDGVFDYDPFFSDTSLEQKFENVGNRRGIDPKILKAVATVESSLDPSAINPLDPSFGVMQILCKSPTPEGRCLNNLYVQGWPSSQNKLLNDVEHNIDIGAQILKWNIDTYGFERGIAVYNSWGARNDPESGPFRNQKYVDKVLREFNSLNS